MLILKCSRMFDFASVEFMVSGATLTKFTAYLVDATSYAIYPRTTFPYTTDHDQNQTYSQLSCTFIVPLHKSRDGFSSKPINLSNNEEESQCIFFCNESLNPPGWLTSFPWQKISHRSPMEFYSGLIALCQFITLS